MKKIKLALLILFLLGTVFAVHSFNYYFPLRHIELINHYADKHGVDPVLVASLINVESRFDAQAVSHAGASGLMQLMPGTANWIADAIGMTDFDFDTQVFDPAVNINMGTWYIARLINNHYDVTAALAAYNAGSGNVANWLQNPQLSTDGLTLEHIPFPETRRYVAVVTGILPVYRFRLWLGWS